MGGLVNEIELLRFDPDIARPVGVTKRKTLGKCEARLKLLTAEAKDSEILVRHLREAEAIDEALRSAAAQGDLKTFQIALDQGAAIDAPDYSSNSASGVRALDFACGLGHVAIVEACLKNGADPLGGALGFGRYVGVGVAQRDILKKKSAITEVEALACAETQPLILATERGHLTVVRALLNGMNDDDQKTFLINESKDSSGRTALHAAAKRIRLDIAEALLAYDPLVDALDHDNATPLHLAASNNALASISDDAVTSFIQLLLKHGADASKKDVHGRTPRDLALAKGNRLAVITFLNDLKDRPAEPPAPSQSSYTKIARSVFDDFYDQPWTSAFDDNDLHRPSCDDVDLFFQDDLPPQQRSSSIQVA